MRLLAILLLLLATSANADNLPVPRHRPDPDAAALAGPALADDPVALRRFACPALMQGLVGGKLAPPVREGECGESAPLEITAAGGVALTGRPLVTCAMAGEIAWLATETDRIAIETFGAGLKALVTGPGYECRNRNRADGGKLSEHAFANALDIAAFRLADGREIGVEKHWPHWQAPAAAEDSGQTETAGAPKPPPVAERASSAEAKFLAAVHAAACTRFTTVLGPDANAYHHGHFHFDLGCHGRACDFRICE